GGRGGRGGGGGPAPPWTRGRCPVAAPAAWPPPRARGCRAARCSPSSPLDFSEERKPAGTVPRDRQWAGKAARRRARQWAGKAARRRARQWAGKAARRDPGRVPGHSRPGEGPRKGSDMVTANEQALPSVNDLDLPYFDYNEPGLVGELYHRRLAEVRRLGWLARSPLALVVLDQESGEFFLRARDTAFPGREIADLFGVTGGRLREQIDANILNQTGERHRRLRALVGPAFTPRAAARWRPVMREFAQRLWAG